MLSITWRRPSNVEFPQTWRTFERVSKEQETLKFTIQDITEDWHDEVTEFMIKHYLADENWHSTTGCSTEPIFLEVFKYYVNEYVFPQKASMICLLENDDDKVDQDKKRPILVGCNLTGIAEKHQPTDYSDFVTCEAAKKLTMIFEEMLKHCPNIYEKYNVDKNMGSFGLCVHPDYRGLCISKEMLLTRIPLCKAFGVKISNTMFTGTPSQKVAEKAGFVADACVPYTEIEEAVGFKMRLNYESCKLMTLVMPE